MVNYFAYEKLFEKTVSEDEVLSKYESDLDSKSSYLANLMLSTSSTYKLVHPFRFLRTELEAKRIEGIKEAYYNLKNGTTLVEHFDEESGELDEDLYSAATHFKPRRMIKFAEHYPVYTENDAKLLKLSKKTN
ncbi:MAG: hypothetical protein IKQ35_01980 [Bacilli bacterium]|nr:hypothetical protein [Bacilli bacterium]